ncbi:UDP-N-acetylmuramoyl-tripeptide--D-alanyl-D- alanine ligase [Rickettsiales bacterium Ac37b]|nr:UDP-N-acetylmuramoyl-tripeptide--D-alanyl-D- alanine ligase [Rickettsiales bacterium Ac37b]
MSLWQAEKLAQISQGTLINSTNWQANSFSIDSRLIKHGNIFVAFKGKETDGHLYLEDAFSKGAVAAMVEYIPESNPHHYPLLLIGDNLQALRTFAAYNRDRLDTTMIAITGSAGKTSTKEMIKIAMSSQANIFASYGNYNNLLGTTIGLSNVSLDMKFAIFELGMNHAGEMAELSSYVKPDISIITTVDAAHLEFFGSIEKIAEAKAEIFLHTNKNGFAFINNDSSSFTLLYEKAKGCGIKNIISFGTGQSANCKLIEYAENQDYSLIKADILGSIITYKINSCGKHFASNSLAVLGAVVASGGDLEIAAHNLGNFSALPGRGAHHNVTRNGKHFLVIDDSYNANPLSIRAALNVLSNCRKLQGRKIAILSDVYELGVDAPKLHQELAADVINNDIDKVIAVGYNMQFLYDKLPSEKRLASFTNVDEVIKVIDDYIEDGDMILIKGSFGTSVFKLVKELLS